MERFKLTLTDGQETLWAGHTQEDCMQDFKKTFPEALIQKCEFVPRRVSQVDTEETERIMADLIKGDGGINVLFKETVFEALGRC